MEQQLQPTQQTQQQDNKVVDQTNNNVDNNDDVIKKDELISKEAKELENLNKEYKAFRKEVVKYFLNKYEIRADINLKKLDFKNLESLEYSILKHCEEKGINFKNPIASQEKNKEQSNQINKKGIYF